VTTDLPVGTPVTFDDGTGVITAGAVVRTPWGRGLQYVTIRTVEDRPRTFVRLVREVTPFPAQGSE
jgi:hypothetical protein